MFGLSLRTRKERARSQEQSRQLRLEALEDRSLMAALAGVTDQQPVMEAHAPTAVRAVLLDDGYEQNDFMTAAKNLGTLTSGTTIAHLVMADSADWYRFTTSKTGTTNDNVVISFQHAQGDLNLELYNINGKLLKVSNGTTNVEQVSLNGLAAGSYYVRVFGNGGATNPDYSLTINPPWVLKDDAYENNDMRVAARDLATLLSTKTIDNLVMADGHDWYRFRTTGSGPAPLSLSISSTSTQGNLDLEFYDANGRLLAASRGVTNSEQISLLNQPVTAYFVHVVGVDGAVTPNYTLQINPRAATPAPTPSTSSPFDIQFTFSGLTSSEQAIFEQAAQKWESIIVGDLPNASYNGVVVDDLLISATATAIDGDGNILGQAGPDGFRAGSYLPYHGIMEFDSADLASMLADGSLLGVIEHEMGHVLGIGTIWETKGLLAGAGTSDPRFTGAQATAEYFALTGLKGGVPVENTGGQGTQDGHWRETVFGNELMTGWVGPGSSMPLSRVTIASLADIGYTVNIAVADAFSVSASSVALVTSSSATSAAATGAVHLADARISLPLPAGPHSNHRPNNLPVSSAGQSHRSEHAVAALAHRPHVEAVDEVLTRWSSRTRDVTDFEFAV